MSWSSQSNMPHKLLIMCKHTNQINHLLICLLAGCDCKYTSGGCKILVPAPPGKACRCDYVYFWSCYGFTVDCRDPTDLKCRNPDDSFEACILGHGDCEGYEEYRGRFIICFYHFLYIVYFCIRSSTFYFSIFLTSYSKILT